MSTTGLHDPPDPTELVLSVRDLLADEVLELMEGRLWLRVRVAMNLLDIVARQLTNGPVDELEHRNRLSHLGFENDSELVEAIRTGALDDRYTVLSEVIRDDVWDKVGVANPRYREPYRSPKSARETLSY